MDMNEDCATSEIYPVKCWGTEYESGWELYGAAIKKPAVKYSGFKRRLKNYVDLWAEQPNERVIEHCLYDALHKFSLGGVIYEIIHPVENLTYIGITDAPRLRWRLHIDAARDPKTRLHIEMQKAGAEPFKFREIARLRCPRDTLETIERALIVHRDTIWPSGLNTI